jgi:crossover junction endodeoxyribonuclease RusA
MKLVLPWPPKELNPNAGPHWMALAKAKRRYRSTCAMVARLQGAGPVEAAGLRVHLTFVPPNRRVRDDQNCMAAMKSGLDGLADVLGVDDSRWRTSYEMSPDIGGMVRVEVVSC